MAQLNDLACGIAMVSLLAYLDEVNCSHGGRLDSTMGLATCLRTGDSLLATTSTESRERELNWMESEKRLTPSSARFGSSTVKR